MSLSLLPASCSGEGDEPHCPGSDECSCVACTRVYRQDEYKSKSCSWFALCLETFEDLSLKLTTCVCWDRLCIGLGQHWVREWAWDTCFGYQQRVIMLNVEVCFCWHWGTRFAGHCPQCSLDLRSILRASTEKGFEVDAECSGGSGGSADVGGTSGATWRTGTTYACVFQLRW